MLNGTRQRLLVYHVVMAARKPKGNNRPKSKDQQIDSGGGNPLPGFVASGKKIVTRPVRATATKIGEYVAPIPKGPSMPRTGDSLKSLKGSEVFTPGGSYPGSQVFVRKPALTENQIQGIIQGQTTRAVNQYVRDVKIGAKGAVYGGVAGVATTIGVQQGGREIVEGLTNVVNQIRKSDKLPKSKTPKRR
jgi:hypothetical protein